MLVIVSGGVAVILFRIFQLYFRLDERIREGDATLLDEKGLSIEHVTQAPMGTQFFPPGTQIILSGQAAIDLQNNLRQEIIDSAASTTSKDEAKTAQ